MSREERLRYYKAGYEEGFIMACNAMKWAADDMMTEMLWRKLEEIQDIKLHKGHER